MSLMQNAKQRAEFAAEHPRYALGCDVEGADARGREIPRK